MLAFVPLDLNSPFGVYPIFSNVSTGWEETGSPDPPRHTVHLALTWKEQTGWSFFNVDYFMMLSMLCSFMPPKFLKGLIRGSILF